jgi:hypothetical protein
VLSITRAYYLLSRVGLEDPRRLPNPAIVSNPTIQKEIPLPSDEKLNSSSFSISTLKLASKGLEAHILRSPSPMDFVHSEPAYFENKIVITIRDWTVASDFPLLRIGVPSETKVPSMASAISASVVKAASDRNVPTMYIFNGSLPSEEGFSITTTIYSLIYQLISKINVPDGQTFSFRVARLKELDGETETWDKALSIFSDLLVYAPQTLLIAIDGIERFDRSEKNKEYVDALISFLHNQAQGLRILGKTLKVLFTTTGPCTSLNKFDAKVLKTVTTKRQSAMRRPGEPRLGRSQIQCLIGEEDG